MIDKIAPTKLMMLHMVLFIHKHVTIPAPPTKGYEDVNEKVTEAAEQ